MPQFLSDEWVASARKIREEIGELPAANTPARINLLVTEVPFGDGEVKAYVDTTAGIDLELGHLDTVDATLTLAYDTAKAILVAGDTQAAMAAFMAGQLKVEGDVAKVMGLQTQLQSTDLKPLQDQFLAITD
ncbi:MAG TPA: SCP2 sterol-binding domain-containing protein [Acidimicrobiales bacterium]